MFRIKFSTSFPSYRWRPDPPNCTSFHATARGDTAEYSLLLAGLSLTLDVSIHDNQLISKGDLFSFGTDTAEHTVKVPSIRQPLDSAPLEFTSTAA
ncbi:hypothetical protein [Mesorhizobium sp. M1406]|uniref:hypothetical protein n=1 Tax=Mesorhizobium sp. M1406 TaxID=2957099 RepID=UPI003334E471